MSVLGGLSTLAASYLAKMRGSGEPEASTATCAELENFVRELQAYILDTGHLAGEKHRDTVRQYRERLEKILGNEPTGIIDLVKGGARELGHNVVDYFDHTGHQLGRQWGAQMQGVRSELEGDVSRVQAGIGGVLHDGVERAQGGFDDLEKGLYAEIDRADTGLASVRDRAYGSYNDVRGGLGGIQERATSQFIDARDRAVSQYGDIRERAASQYGDIRDRTAAQYADVQRQAYATADRGLDRMSTVYLPDGRVASIHPGPSPLASPRMYPAGGSYFPATAAAGLASGPLISPRLG